jgi:ubiquinone/menaquinone biosynthesis C-methylase UbiE
LNCNICGKALSDKIYDSGSAKSLTSLCTIYDGPTQVFFCHECGHVQSIEIDNIDEYYDSDYDILVKSEAEDQIYEMVNGAAVYRTEHQVGILIDKVNLSSGMKILDYGCAKSSTMRALMEKCTGLYVHLFDVSDRYIPFWKRFLSDEHWATYVIPDEWNSQFDVVTSFFSLEHMARPQEALRQLSRVLKAGGVFYGIIPNVFANTADMIVVDHVNHFSTVSLAYLLRDNGFEVVEIDEVSHRGALVFKARKVANIAAYEENIVSVAIQSAYQDANKIAQFWQDIGCKIKEFEHSIQNVKRLAIYGAGFYGAFISACLQHPEKIACVIDQNPFLQGCKVNGVDIISPTALPEDISMILVGLNPAYAKSLIEEIPELSSRQLTYFYL